MIRADAVASGQGIGEDTGYTVLMISDQIGASDVVTLEKVTIRSDFFFLALPMDRENVCPGFAV